MRKRLISFIIAATFLFTAVDFAALSQSIISNGAVAKTKTTTTAKKSTKKTAKKTTKKAAKKTAKKSTKKKGKKVAKKTGKKTHTITTTTSHKKGNKVITNIKVETTHQ